MIMRYCEREFAPATSSATRRFAITFPAAAPPYVDLAPYDLRTVSSITVDPDAAATVLTSSQYALGPLPARNGTYTKILLSSVTSFYSTDLLYFGRTEVDVAGAWGFASVPSDVAAACVRTVAAWVNKQVETYGVNAPDSALLPGPAWAIPMASRQMLDRYRRVLV